MDQATLAATFLIVFREALEASLVIGIVLSVLDRLSARRYYTHVIASALVAILLSLVLGIWISSWAAQAQDQAKKLIEGLISLVACAVLTWMIFWMDRQGRKIRSEIEERLEVALSRQEYVVMITLPFFSVLREGAETVLFLKAMSIQASGELSWLGGLAGAFLAVLVTSLVFVGGKRVPLKVLFRSTGLFLLVVAAGLLAYGVHELEELGWIRPIIYPLWNMNHILNEKEGIGAFLKALFGYNGNPSLTEVILYWFYLLLVGYLIVARNIKTSPARTS